jgi:PAS domain S-box-containing protein
MANLSVEQSPVASVRYSILIACTVGLLYFLLARFALSLVSTSSGIAVLWPAAGVAAGALLAASPERRRWIAVAVAIAVVAANLLVGKPPLTASIFALANVGEAALCAWTYRRLNQGRHGIDHPRDLVGLATASVVAASVAAFSGSALLALVGDMPFSLDTCIKWMTSDIVGVLAIAPVFLVPKAGISNGQPPAKLVSAALVVAGAGLLAWFVLVTPAFMGTALHNAPFIALLPAVLWVGLRAEPCVGATAGAAMALAITGGAVLQQGIFSPNEHFIYPVATAQVLMLAASLAMLALSLHLSQLRAVQARQALLLRLADVARAAQTPRDGIAQGCRILGEHFAVSRVGFGEVGANDDDDNDNVVIRHEHCKGKLESAAGTHLLAAYGPETLAYLKSGETLVVDNVFTDNRTAAASAIHIRFGTRAAIIIPMIKNGRLRATLYLNHGEARNWTGEDVQTIKEFAHRAFALLEHARAEEHRALAEQELQAIFDAAPIGLCVFDRNLRYIRINERLAEINGIPAADHIGKTPKQIVPDLDETAVATMRRVLAGEAMYGVDFVGTTKAQPGVVRTWRQNWIPYENGAGDIIGITVSADDVTLEKSEEARAQVRLELIEMLRVSPREALVGAATIVGKHFGVSRAGFAEIESDDDTIIVRHEYRDGSVTVNIGASRLSEYGGAIVDELRAGRTLCVEDVSADPRTAGESATHIAVGSRAALAVPLIREGRLRGTFYAKHHEVKRYDPEDIALIEDIAARAWATMEQARAEERLHETKRRLDAVLDNASVAIFLMDERQHCSYMNAAAEALTGYSFAETQGRPLHDVVHHTYPDGRPFPLSECAIDRAFPENANTRGEEVFVHKDGSFIPVAFVASPIRDEASKTVGTIIEVRNIAEEKAAITALASSEAQFRTTAEALPGLLFVVSNEGSNVYVNQEFCDYTGLTHEALLGFGWAEALHPDDRIEPDAFWSQRPHIATSYESELRIRRHDGQWRWHMIRALPITGGDGRAERWVGTGVDIHDRKQTEADLQREIATVVAQREIAFAQLHEAQKLETLGQLTGGVAHDFNNLLTPVMMGLEMLRRAHEDSRSQKLIGGALESAERAKTLVQRLLAFARRQALEPRPVDPKALIQDMRELIGRSLGPAIKVVVEAGDNLPAAMVDPNQLELALLNLSVNARDAMPDGGVLTIVVEAEQMEEGEAPGLAAGRYVRFSVTDTGSGMDAETLRRAVEPFFSTKEIGQGTGLGLSMVHGLAGQSGGNFRLSSQPGVGTTAVLWLPATELEPTNLRQTVQGVPGAARTAILLLVDDEELVRVSTADGLRSLGYIVIEAASAAQALEQVRKGPKPDLLITDHMMPGTTGAQLVASLRDTAPDIRVLMITGYAALDPQEAEGLHVLAKPYGLAELASRVAAMLHEGKVVQMSDHARSAR